ncbi:hypothetical protein VNO80_09921 [Phaseolus coccineus]|uniref:Uncharacterized protein n=1 Tax=Phaseolus coccineus TaxID=3886 RepID=A0AAN9N8Z8_PHACN
MQNSVYLNLFGRKGGEAFEAEIECPGEKMLFVKKWRDEIPPRRSSLVVARRSALLVAPLRSSLASPVVARRTATLVELRRTSQHSGRFSSRLSPHPAAILAAPP